MLLLLIHNWLIDKTESAFNMGYHLTKTCPPDSYGWQEANVWFAIGRFWLSIAQALKGKN